MILLRTNPQHGYLTAGTSLSSQAILVAHFFFGCAGRQKEMKKSAPRVQVISRLKSLLITVASMWDRVRQAWLIAGDERKVDVRTVRARLFSVDEVLRFAGKASVHTVLVALSFRHDTASSMGSVAAVQ